LRVSMDSTRFRGLTLRSLLKTESSREGYNRLQTADNRQRTADGRQQTAGKWATDTDNGDTQGHHLRPGYRIFNLCSKK
jgi:hypothetical protein